MKKTIVRLVSVLTAFVILALVPASAFAAGEEMPSLFHNDEAWYKDGSHPLLERNGEYYAPAEIFAMFDYISVTTPTENNLLIHNTASGEYVSILFKEQSAAINGQIVSDVVAVRDSGVYYVNAEVVSDAIGVRSEYYTTGEGKTSLRLYDSSRKLSFGTLAEAYLPQQDEYEDTQIGGTVNVLKRIYILCKTPSGIAPEYIAKYNLDKYGLEYTMLLTSKVEVEDILEASARGTYGLIPLYTQGADGVDIAAELDGMNELFLPYTKREARLTLSTGNREKDKILEKMGYIPIKPDFTVNGSSDAGVLFTDMINYLTKNGVCTVLLEDCWNSGEVARLISEIDYPYYTTSNLSNAN